MRAVVALLGLLLLAGCTTPATTPADHTPAQAILGAAENPAGLSGIFKLTVLGTGWQGRSYFLNSQADYRDQRCLTIAFPPPAVKKLADRFGDDLDGAFKGKTIRVTGTAKRVTIWFLNPDGSRSDKYYYQTHVNVMNPLQVEVLP